MCPCGGFSKVWTNKCGNRSRATIQHCLKKGKSTLFCICREHCGNFLHARQGCCLNKYITSNTFYGFNFCYGLSVINKCFVKTIYRVATFIAEIKCCWSNNFYVEKTQNWSLFQQVAFLTAVYISFNLSRHTVGKEHFNL